MGICQSSKAVDKINGETVKQKTGLKGPQAPRGRDDKTSTMIREQLIEAAHNARVHVKETIEKPEWQPTIPSVNEDNNEDDKENKRNSGNTGSTNGTSDSNLDTVPSEHFGFKLIRAEPITISASYVPPFIEKTDDEITFLDQCLRDNFFCSNLTSEERSHLINTMERYTVNSGDSIIRQGDTDNYFYVLQKGEATFIVDGEEVGQVGEGGSFGELALVYESQRAATVRAETPCELFRVDQKTYRAMVANTAAKSSMENIKVLRKVELFKNMDDNDLTKISDALIEVAFRDGKFIVRKGEQGRIFYIIKQGEVAVTDIGSSDKKYTNQILRVGNYFGERALLTGDRRCANVKAHGDCVMLCLSKEAFETTLGPVQSVVDKALYKRMLMGIPIFANTSVNQKEVDNLVDDMQVRTFKKDEIIAKEGDLLCSNSGKRALYLIKEGKLAVTSSKQGTDVLSRGDYCLDLSHEKALSTVSALEDTTCKLITMSDIERSVGSLDRLNDPEAEKENTLDTTMTLDVLEKHNILGEGAFGQVWLVSRKGSKETYALKIQNKRQVMKEGQVDGIIREKNLMANLNHPFVIKMVNAFQDENNLFMVMKLVLGGELYNVIQSGMSRGKRNTVKMWMTRRGNTSGVSEQAAKFYAACVFEGLRYMHEKQILYRDLKPENVLIDGNGYCVLVDLGFAKVVTDKTYTICGTPFYLAPEILISRGYDQGADHWAFGVLVYEMMFGYCPFFSYDDDQITLFKRIVKLQYSIPSWSKASKESHDLIQRILVKKPERLGSLANGELDIQNHAWLADMSPKDLLSYSIQAPWIPPIKDSFDVSNFDDWKHLEDKQDLSSPPSPREQALFEGF